MRAGAALLVLAAALTAACSGGGGVEPVAVSSCTGLVYEGEGEPDVIVVSDLPLRGTVETPRLMVDAIEFVLREREFRAGDLRVGYQSCNDAIGDRYDESLCRRNAQAYVDTADVVGVIGPYNSGCAEMQIPVVSRGDAGPLAMISPSNTDHSLTRTGAARERYPDGVRSYARVVTHDHSQGIAAAHLAKRLGARRVAVIHQSSSGDPYVYALTVSFLAAARELGVETTSFPWVLRRSYAALAASAAAARPDVVYLVGFPEVNAKTLVEDLRAAVPSRVVLVTPDSFSGDDMAQELGPAGEGLLTTVPGIPPDVLPPAGRRFLREFGSAGVLPGHLGAPEAAQAAEVLLDAISRSDGTRASVVEALFATKVEDGILGSFSFDSRGDVVPASVGIYRYEGGKLVADSVVRARLDALGG